MIRTDIVIIDSGVNLEHSSSDENGIQGLRISFQNDDVQIDDNFNDDYGHGTAVYNIIKKHSPSSEILNIKLFGDSDSIEEEALIYALNYIKDNISCKLINLSLGLKMCRDIEALRKICSEFVTSGVILVSAFDNDGCFSFPAAFDDVIGVDSSYECKGSFDFEIVEGSPINIRAKGGIQRVAWSSGKDMVLGGSSFACAYVSSYIANLIKDKNLTSTEIIKDIRGNSKLIYPGNHNEIKISNEFFDIERAAVFPFNKEMHSLIRFSESLTFNIEGIYDIRQSGRIGASIKNLLDYSELDSEKNFIIKDFQTIDYELIDTVVLGHVEEINRMLKRDIRREIILKAIENDVNIFSFDPLDYCAELFKDSKIKVFFPKISEADIPQNTFGKLYNISNPVLAVFGTSSRQGKFSLQLILKNLLEKLDYKVGTIGTEPQSLLFGMDYVYPMGYNSTIYINELETITLLNTMLHKLSRSEIIMVGSQSNSVPYNFMNLSAFPVKQHSFLLGIQPDTVILCVNPYDDINYIYNTIKYLEGIVDCKVIAIVMFPMSSPNDWRGMFSSKTKITDDEFNLISSKIHEHIKLPVYKLSKETDMINLRDLIIEFFN